MKKVEKVVIIGSGPAGLTAAIYAARADLEPVVISGRALGGQLTLTTDVDDFPGFPQGVQGPELMMKMREQASRFNTRFIDEEVSLVKFGESPFEIKTESEELLAYTVVIATGASARWLGLSTEQRLIGKGVSACAVCDGPFYRNKIVAVVGGGDVALREAQHLSKYAKTVFVIHRRDDFRAKAALVDLVKTKPNIEFILNSVVEEVLGKEKVEGLKLKNIKTDEISKIEVDGMFTAIGHDPNTKFLERQIELDENGHIVVKNETQTSVPGVFVAGDVSDIRYRQAITAAGAGCKAALDAEDYLEHHKS